MLIEWIKRYAQGSGGFSLSRILEAATMARVPLEPGAGPIPSYTRLVKACLQDANLFIDVIDAIASLNTVYHSERNAMLVGFADVGNWAWTLSPRGDGITRRVDPTAQAAAEQALLPGEAASRDLGEAWRSAYGPVANGSDAWDHAIKACEHILKPLVSPANDRATLGTIIRDLRAQVAKWQLVVPGKDESHSIEPLLAMLDLIWPNHDRHGDGTPKTVDLAAAQAVVHLAVTIVQWVRSSALVKKTRGES